MSFFTQSIGGAVVVGRVGGGDPESRDYVVNDTALIVRGDLVKSTTGGDSTDGHQAVVKAGAGDTPRGVVLDIKPLMVGTGALIIDPALITQASVRYILRVCDDPLAVILLTPVSTGAGSTHTVTYADVGKFANIETTAGSSTTGASNTFLDGSTVNSSGSGLQLKILDVLNTGVTSLASNPTCRCMFNSHELFI